MRNGKQSRKTSILFVLATLTISIPLFAAIGDYKKDISTISQQILDTAEDLKKETNRPVIDSEEIGFLLDDMKGMLKDYENMLVFAESPCPGEILLGKTPHVNDTWAETVCDGTARPVKEIQLKRNGPQADYIRINDIELTYQTPTGLRKEVFNKSGRIRFYANSVFKLVLPQPMRVTHTRILIEHESAGIQVYGIY